MNQILLRILVVSLFFASTTSLIAQTPTDPDPNRTKIEGSKQNQTQYHDPEMESDDDFSYQKRNKISRPLMPRYDYDSAVYQTHKKKRAKQQGAYKNNEYYYPSMPKNAFELELLLGMTTISGDVKTKVFNPLTNWVVGAGLRKAVGYAFSFRLMYTFARAQGEDWEPKFNSRHNPALDGRYNSDLNYVSNPELLPGGTLNIASTDPTDLLNPDVAENRNMRNIVWHNYRTEIHELELHGIINLNNAKFHRERNRFGVYAFFGIGGMMYTTSIDQLDENGNMYDYSRVADFFYNFQNTGSNNFIKNQKRKETLNMLKDLRDGEYESVAENHKNEQAIGKYVFNPAASVGFAVGWHMSKRVTMNWETKVTFTNDDLIDGQRWQENSWDGLTRDFDNYVQSYITINFNLGKKAVEPLWWLNPMDYTYKKLGDMDPDKIIDDLLEDDDNDGVPNRMDEEAETPENCPVDVKGVALDSDGDGCLDCMDKEPFSPPGYEIDENCVAIIPQIDPECCDNVGTGFPCDQIDELPSIHFASDKYYINPEYYAALHTVAERMIMCPDLTVVATGHTDVHHDEKYNEKLSWNRVNQSVEYLVDKYGVSRDRFIVNYKGEVDANDLDPEARRVSFRAAGDGESGESNPADPHPGLDAGSDR